MKKTAFSLLFSCLMLCGIVTAMAQAPAAPAYQTPPKAIADLITAPGTPSISLTPTNDRYIIAEMSGLPSIKDVAQEELGLAGVRVLASTNGPKANSKILSLTVYAVDNSPKALAKSKIIEGKIQGLPSDPILSFSYDPTGKRVAMYVEKDNGIECWVAELATLQARKVSNKLINGFFGLRTEWLPDGTHLIISAIPPRTMAPQPDNTPQGPVVQISDGKAAPVRTFQDLLKDSYSEALFDYYAQSEMWMVDLSAGTEKLLLPKGIYTSFDLSPDANYFLTTTIQKPYSYVVTLQSFPNTTDLWSIDGKKIKQMLKNELQENSNLARGSVRPGMRGLSWRPDQAAMLYWVEALDGGDAKKEVEKRDEVWMLNAPFTGSPVSLLKTDLRYSGISWGDARHAFLNTSDAVKKMRYTYMFDPQSPEKLTETFTHFTEDRYNEPGNMLRQRNEFGRQVIYSPDNFKTIYLSGAGYGPEGSRPYIDQMTLATKKSNRLWQCSTTHYESPVSYIDLKAGQVIIRRESPTEWPNYYILNLKNKKMTAMTQFEDPYPMMAGVSKEVVEYTRADGIPLRGTLYLPAGYKKEDGPLPVFMWAYPAEFQSADGAGQRTDSPNTYIRVSRSGIVPYVTQGYAIFDNASFPIVGSEEIEPNDTFVEQLILNAEAAINVLAEMGVGDPKRVAVGGHSYGAFMTANLLAHSSLFAAGVARSGAYNRSLTPFGFQNERRTFWEGNEVYLKMSPFWYADKLKTPILFVHGLADNNSGTFTVQSERMFAAVKGNGGIAKLVLLPAESHGYAAQESMMHVAWETCMWLDQYVKNKK